MSFCCGNFLSRDYYYHFQSDLPTLFVRCSCPSNIRSNKYGLISATARGKLRLHTTSNSILLMQSFCILLGDNNKVMCPIIQALWGTCSSNQESTPSLCMHGVLLLTACFLTSFTGSNHPNNLEPACEQD